MPYVHIAKAGDGRWRLTAVQRIAAPRSRVFPFFADASNLARITPTEMGFEIITPSPIAMAEGTRIDYRIRILGVPLRWRSLITRWDPPIEFADEQLHGPYDEWRHLHRFTAQSDGATLMEDEVIFRLPFGPLGALAAPLVRRQLRQIFRHRRSVIAELEFADAS